MLPQNARVRESGMETGVKQMGGGGGHGRQKQETRTLMGEDSREVVEKQKDKESECNA